MTGNDSIFSPPNQIGEAVQKWCRELSKGPAERAAERMAAALRPFAECATFGDLALAKLKDRKALASVDGSAILEARDALEEWESTDREAEE